MPPKKTNRSRSRNKSPKKSLCSAPPKDPLRENRSDNDSVQSHDTDPTSHTQKKSTSVTDNVSTPSEIINQHSAQAQLNQALDTNSYNYKLQQLQSKAANKKATLLDKASAIKQKMASKKAAKSSKRNLKDDDDYVTDDHDDDDSESEGSDSELAPGSKNYYSSLRKRQSQMSISERKHVKAIQRKHRTYCGLKIQIPDNEDPMVTLVRHTALLFEQIQIVDPKSIIYAYNDNAPSHAIKTPKDIPTSYVSYKEFFVGAQSRTDKGTVWCTIWMGHEKTFHEIHGNVGIWSKLYGSRIFEKALQVKNR